jgi:hypothetical protein
MIQNISKSTFLVLSISILFSCVTTKELIDDEVKLDRVKTNVLVDLLDTLSLKKPSFFYAKISTDFSDTTTNLKFKTSLRMVKDSAINLLFTYAKFPVANAIISNDSLTIVNKKEKCFIHEDLGYIKETFGIDFVYQNLEEVFLGLPLDFDADQKYFQIHDENQYIISSHRKHKIKRNEKKVKEDVLIKYMINKDRTNLSGMYISSPSDSTEININYLSREQLEQFDLPKNVSIRVKTPRNSINISLEYDKSEINQPQPLILVIPSGYEQCK